MITLLFIFHFQSFPSVSAPPPPRGWFPLAICRVLWIISPYTYSSHAMYPVALVQKIQTDFENNKGEQN